MKPTIILCARDGRPSMKKVYSQMSGGSLEVLRRPKKGKSYVRLYENNNSEVLVKKPIDSLDASSKVLIRWGNRVSIPTDEHSITYNRMDGIKNATNKKLSRELFMQNNVQTAKLVTPDTITDAQMPVIARPFTHSKGKNFVVLTNRQDFILHYRANNTGWYYSEFIDKEQEFRVHCANGKVLAIMEKPRGVGIAWNRAQNHEAFIRVMQANYIHDVCLQALLSMDAVGLDFGGVDVLYKNGKAYVIEINTSPTLNSSEYVSERYAKYFTWLSKSDKRLPHWEYKKYKKPISFAWTEKQLSGETKINTEEK